MRLTDAPRRHRRALAPLGVLGVLVLLISLGIAVHPRWARAARFTDVGATGVTLDPDLRPKHAGEALGRAEAPAGFSIENEPARMSVQALPVLPGETVVLSAPTGASVLRYGAGQAQPTAPGRWRWTAPRAPGIYALEMSAGADTLSLTALVLHPASEVRGGFLNGYRMGRYQARALRGESAYVPPRGFVEVRAVDRDILVSPHFRLGQFLCKEPGEPRYVALSVPLLVKLEAVSDKLVEMGYAPGSLTVMSGYRTPAYNRAIGNTTDYSRHLWGDAADLYVDADGDGRMDDLDGNGVRDVRDARVLYRVVESVESSKSVRLGGLGLYGPTAAHGPFVHVDARGRSARW